VGTFPHRLIGAILVSLFFTEAAFSQTSRPPHESRPPLPEFVQEFFLSDAVRCQGAGELQITSIVDSRQGIGSNSRLELQYGLTNRLQTGLELPYGRREEEGFLARDQSWDRPPLELDISSFEATLRLHFLLGLHLVYQSRQPKRWSMSPRF
jgi:hypothetical protein